MKVFNLILVILFPLLFLTLRLSLLSFLPTIQLKSDPLFLFDLIGRGLTLPIVITALAGVACCILFYQICSLIFNRQVGFYTAFVFGVCPWSAYLELSASTYMLLLVFLLTFLLGLIYLHQQNKKLGLILILAGLVLTIYSSILAGIVLLALTVGLFYSPIFRLEHLSRNIIIILLISLVPLLILCLANHQGLINIVKLQFNIFFNQNIETEANVLRGESTQSYLQILSRLVENKYLLNVQNLFINFLSILSPAIYFSPQNKLLNFSFSPPLFAAFLVPFFYGLYSLRQFWTEYKFWSLLIFLLCIPAILCSNAPALDRLILFSPVLVITVGLGLYRLSLAKTKLTLAIFYLIWFLVGIQFTSTIADILIREPLRWHQILGG